MTDRRFFVLSFVLLMAAAACRTKDQTPVYPARIGIAVKLSDRICMAIHNAKLLPSATITLLAPVGVINDRSSTARAFVLSRNADACPGTKTDAEVSNYNLEISSGTVRPDFPLIAVEARVPSVYAAHSFHACASADGVHLTAWDGAKPLEGRRLWQQYYYLGRELKSSCTTAETVP